MFTLLRSWWQDRLLRGVVKNSSYLFSSTTVAAALTMLQGIFAARLLGVEVFGILSAAIPFVSNVNRLLSFRMSELVVKYLSQYLVEDEREKGAAVVKLTGLVEMVTSIASYGVLVLIAPLGARYILKDVQTQPLIVAFGVYLLAHTVYETSLGVMQVHKMFDRLALINLVQSILTAGMIFGAYLMRMGLREVLLAYLAGKIFLGLATTVLALRQMRRSFGRGWWRTSLDGLPPLRELARFAVSTNLQVTVNLVVRDSEILLISFLRTPAEAGYFKIALGLINLVMMPIDPMIAPTYAEISRAISEKMYAQTRRLLKRVSLIAGVWTIGTGVVLALFGFWIIPLMYGSEYAPAAPALSILIIGYGFANIVHWNRPLLLALGMPDYSVKVSGAVGAVKTALSFLLVPAFGYLAEAAVLTVYFLASIGMVVQRGMRELHSRQHDAEAGLGVLETLP